MDSYTLKVERRSGAWFVSSPEIPGLLVAAPTELGALALIPKYLGDLQKARELKKAGKLERK